jgi:NTP pyrophosphatase (non-canonical NTP hydrolase)
MTFTFECDDPDCECHEHHDEIVKREEAAALVARGGQGGAGGNATGHGAGIGGAGEIIATSVSGGHNAREDRANRATATCPGTYEPVLELVVADDAPTKMKTELAEAYARPGLTVIVKTQSEHNRDMHVPEPFTLAQLQSEQRDWVAYNFPGREPFYPLLGAVEELGELAHAHLKMLQGIRGTKEEHMAAAADAVADTIIFLADYCSEMGIDLQETVSTTWQKVKRRDWQKDPQNGGGT